MKQRDDIFVCDGENLKTVAPLCKKYGFGIEIQSFYHPDLLDNSIEEAIKGHRKELNGINRRSLHGPFGDLCPGSFDSKVRELAKFRLNQSYSAAKELNVSDLVFHHCYVPKTSPPKSYLERSIEFWKTFLSGKDMKIHIENLLEWDEVMISELINGVNNVNFDVCLDIGHCHCNSKKSVVDWIRLLNNKIGYVHLHDNSGATDEHLGLGRGTIPLEEVFSALLENAPNAIWALEVAVSGMESSIEWLLGEGHIG